MRFIYLNSELSLRTLTVKILNASRDENKKEKFYKDILPENEMTLDRANNKTTMPSFSLSLTHRDRNPEASGYTQKGKRE